LSPQTPEPPRASAHARTGRAKLSSNSIIVILQFVVARLSRPLRCSRRYAQKFKSPPDLLRRWLSLPGNHKQLDPVDESRTSTTPRQAREWTSAGETSVGRSKRADRALPAHSRMPRIGADEIPPDHGADHRQRPELSAGAKSRQSHAAARWTARKRTLRGLLPCIRGVPDRPCRDRQI